MSVARFAACLLGVLLTTALVAATAPARAGEPPRARLVEPTSRLAVGDPDPPRFGGPSHRTIHSEVIGRGSRIFLRGDVEAHPRGAVVIQRKVCRICAWRRSGVVETRRSGWFRSEITAPRRGSYFWRAKVRASGGYRTSWSATWETYY